MKTYTNIFNSIIASENLFAAWDTFKKDKRNKRDVMAFEWRLEENIFALHRELKAKTYRHGSYSGFYITDPKQRHIHKALVRDRILHHAVFSVVNPIFEPTFITNSFSCRKGYGSHRGVDALARMLRSVSRNNTRPAFALKCDVQKFFDSVNHSILLSILKQRIKDPSTVWLLEEIVESFSEDTPTLFERCGIPIGNLTSQLFANIYMNELDQFMKQTLRLKHYVRYTDDFVIVGEVRNELIELLPKIRSFLWERLRLRLHPKKISIHKYHQGVDFLGYLQFPEYRVMRRKTQNRIFKKMRRNASWESLQSYLGALSHANSYKVSEKLKNEYWLFSNNRS